jgi:hypothetical protein
MKPRDRNARADAVRSGNEVVFVRAPRARKHPSLGRNGTLFAVDSEPSSAASETKGGKNIRQVSAGLRKRLVHVVNRPPRFPPIALWPIELRADMVAAMLDYASTYELCRAIHAGEAPRPTSWRGRSSSVEVTWYRDDVLAFIMRRHGCPGLSVRDDSAGGVADDQ